MTRSRKSTQQHTKKQTGKSPVRQKEYGSIRKSSGQKEPFDLAKLTRSLRKAGASKGLAENIARQVEKEQPRNTKEIHLLAIKLLEKSHPPVAARYNLKRALIDLGPAGFPFEQFIARLFAAQGYRVKTNEIVPGHCVSHEVDIVAEKDGDHFMIECKFHNRINLKSDVKVSLYVQARFEDIHQAWDYSKSDRHQFHQAWIVCNTQFTSEAITYGECRDMKLISWAYPLGENLARMIDRLGLHPITALTRLSGREKRLLIKNGLVLCQDAKEHRNTLKKLGIPVRKIAQILRESKEVCELPLSE